MSGGHGNAIMVHCWELKEGFFLRYCSHSGARAKDDLLDKEVEDREKRRGASRAESQFGTNHAGCCYANLSFALSFPYDPQQFGRKLSKGFCVCHGPRLQLELHCKRPWLVKVLDASIRLLTVTCATLLRSCTNKPLCRFKRSSSS